MKKKKAKTQTLGSTVAPSSKGFVDNPPFNVLPISVMLCEEALNNAKIHTEEQIHDIAESIKAFGFRDPIAVVPKGSAYEIVEGHGRVKAMAKIGRESIPAMVFHDMTPDQVIAYRIAHNKIAADTGFDEVALALDLQDLQTSGFDIALTGFSIGDLDLLKGGEDLDAPDQPVNVESDESDDFDLDAEDSGGAQKAGEDKDAMLSVYQYVIIFDDKEQQKQWLEFLKLLKEQYEGDTIAERLSIFIQDLYDSEEATAEEDAAE